MKGVSQVFVSLLHGGSYVQNQKRKIFYKLYNSTNFHIYIGIILFFSSLLDVDSANYILRTNPELFHLKEQGFLAKHLLDTNFYWISTLGYAFNNSLIFIGSYVCNKEETLFNFLKLHLGINFKGGEKENISFVGHMRIGFILFAIAPVFFAIGWFI